MLTNELTIKLARHYRTHWSVVKVWLQANEGKILPPGVYQTFGYDELINFRERFPQSYKAVLFTRHPVDVIISSFRYHKVAKVKHTKRF